jgi:hypothetical protein
MTCWSASLLEQRGLPRSFLPRILRELNAKRRGRGPVVAAGSSEGTVVGSAGAQDTTRAWRGALQPLSVVDAIPIDDILMIGI